MLIKLVRHGQSMQNTDEVDGRAIGDHLIPLTPVRGLKQALDAGALLGAEFLRGALTYCSPYLRTRQTLANVMVGGGVFPADMLPDMPAISACAVQANLEGLDVLKALQSSGDATKSDDKEDGPLPPNLVRLAASAADLGDRLRALCKERKMRFLEDPRLREVEHGFADVNKQWTLQQIHSTFFYRFKDGGESPADCYDRICTFLESMMRQCDRKQNAKALIVSHGLTIRCFVMRWLHLSIEQFERIKNPWNCDIITIGHHADMKEAQFTNGKYGVTGLRLR